MDGLKDAFGRTGAAPVRVEEPVTTAPAAVPQISAPPAGEPRVLRVGDLAGGIRAVLEEVFDDVWVEGELSNVHRHASGHLYFTLRDEDGALRGVLWRSQAARVFFQPRDGMLVRVRGRVSFYEARGETQLVGRELTLAGEGALAKTFEALKARLLAEGLFDPARKRTLPAYPERIGLVTSLGGAALQDMLAVLGRRFRLAEVLVIGVAVQGLGAAEAVAAAIAAFGALPAGDPLRPDVLIVGRGGGSAEDLWAFNEEAVARAIFASPIPVVSAVGHETDVSIADFVADVRAATPSMAAELVAPHAAEVEALVNGFASSMHEALRYRIAAGRQRLALAVNAPGMRRPEARLREARHETERLAERLRSLAVDRVRAEETRAVALAARLGALDPLAPLRRGYALVTQDGRRITRAADLRAGAPASVRFGEGEATVRRDDGVRGDGAREDWGEW